MIDIHSHLLPTIDDGARSLQETIDMVKEAKSAGFTDIVTTSHYIDGQFDVNKNDRKILISKLQELLDDEIKLHNGAEAYVTPELVSLYQKGIIPTLADSRYVLFESYIWAY